MVHHKWNTKCYYKCLHWLVRDICRIVCNKLKHTICTIQHCFYSYSNTIMFSFLQVIDGVYISAIHGQFVDCISTCSSLCSPTAVQWNWGCVSGYLWGHFSSLHNPVATGLFFAMVSSILGDSVTFQYCGQCIAINQSPFNLLKNAQYKCSYICNNKAASNLAADKEALTDRFLHMIWTCIYNQLRSRTHRGFDWSNQKHKKTMLCQHIEYNVYYAGSLSAKQWTNMPYCS